MDNSQIENTINEIRKRNGTVTAFDLDKISNAIFQALAATSKADRGVADNLAGDVLNKLVEQGFTSDKAPTVEDIQDIVESTLIDSGNSDIAKSYIVYRHERRKLRDEKMRVLNLKVLDPVSKKFDLNCLRVLASRYLFRNSKSEIIETPTQMFERVARPADRFVNPYANDNEARANNNGAYPPDLSVITKARKYGADYIYNLLLGYVEPPKGMEVGNGMYYNKWMDGNQIAMPAPILDGSVAVSYTHLTLPTKA